MSSEVKVRPDVVPATRRRRIGRRRQLFWAIVFLTPAIASLVILRIAPTIDAISSSLFKGFPGGIIPSVFAGLANYQQLFADPTFVATIWRTIGFNLVINPLQIVIALLFAVLMTRRVKFSRLWTTLIFVPVAVPIVGSSIAWGTALGPQGPVNAIISALGGHPQQFFGSPQQALACIIVVFSWIGIGYWMLFLIAGIQAIPEELYEAARLDRAGPVRTLLQITIPLLKRPLLFVLVADTVANFVAFVPIQILTNGGPQGSTTMLMFNAYQTTFTYGSSNQGAAQIAILTAIMLVFVLAQFWLLREERDGA